MIKILQETFIKINEETKKIPICIFYDGITSTKDLFIKNLKIYVVFQKTEEIYINEQYEMLDSNDNIRIITVKTINLNDLSSNNKYMTAFIFSYIDNMFGITKNNINFVENILKSLTIRKIIISLKDKIYNNVIKLEKQKNFDDEFKELCLINVRLIDIITSLLNEQDLKKAIDNSHNNIEKQSKDFIDNNSSSKKSINDIVNYFKKIIKYIDNCLNKENIYERKEL